MAQELCNYFQDCGGCSLQHLEYSVQLENKRKFLSSIIKFDDIKVFSGKNFAYRNRMDFIFHSASLGLRKKRNWKRKMRCSSIRSGAKKNQEPSAAEESR